MELLQIHSTHDLVSYLLTKGILLSPEQVTLLGQEPYFSLLKQFITQREQEGVSFDERSITQLFISSLHTEDTLSLHSSTTSSSGVSDTSLHTNVQVVYSYREYIKKREVQDFVTYLNNRYNSLATILMKRDLPALTSINKIYAATTTSRTQEEISIIGIVYSIEKTKNGHTVLE